jgi:hypothetical protein
MHPLVVLTLVVAPTVLAAKPEVEAPLPPFPPPPAPLPCSMVTVLPHPITVQTRKLEAKRRTVLPA